MIAIISGSFSCKNRKQCINNKYLCDGDVDCDDGSDESMKSDGPCNPDKICSTLGENGFRCDENRCIPKIQVCDQVEHCVDGIDESAVTCTNVKCDQKQFRCKSGKQCIPLTWVCDGSLDCVDRSDETDECSECLGFQCDNKVCISAEQRCDGSDNCG